MKYGWWPSAMASPWPVTITCWGVVPFSGVKVNSDDATGIVPSVVSLLLSAIVTLAVGSVESATVNVAVPPASVVVRPLDGVTRILAVVTGVQTENSDVSRLMFVAVAVITWFNGIWPIV